MLFRSLAEFHRLCLNGQAKAKNQDHDAYSVLKSYVRSSIGVAILAAIGARVMCADVSAIDAMAAFPRAVVFYVFEGHAVGVAYIIKRLAS